ncbi:MAG: endolytic transglycosylase MltG [Terriglobales bacterium]
MRKLLTFLLLAALAFGAWLAWGVLTPVAPGGQKFLMLRSGLTTRKIAAELKGAGVIRSERAFLVWHFFHRKRSLKAGEYLFEKPATAIEVHNRLARGDIYTHTVVIPEGYTMFDIAQAIEQAGLGTKDDFLKIARGDTELIRDFAPQATTLEGYLFPDTYEFTRTQSLHDIAAVMVHHFRQVATAIGLTNDVPQTVTMASIVEKETAAPQERPLVASVYYNRLTKRMALDADPSVIYAELLAGTYQGALHHDDLRINSLYNTYRYPGLPPGPIGNPGRSSLEAAMHPAVSDYLYFVSDGNGHHRFARSLEEHNRNVNAFRIAIRRQ